jgi:hypothetical protein
MRAFARTASQASRLPAYRNGVEPAVADCVDFRR